MDDDRKTAHKDKDGVFMDISIPDEYQSTAKRQKIEEPTESGREIFGMRNAPSDQQLEQSFEERRFNELIQFGLELGKGLDDIDQRDSEGESSLFTSSLDENGSNVMAAMDVGGVSDDLIQGSTIPECLEVC